MSFKIRQISVLLRRWDSLKDRRRVLRRFSEWREDQNSLPPPAPLVKRLLIIRLDDIGDYLLFRNQLGLYKKSPRWQGYSITLLGNASWQPVFTLLDSATVDETLWVNKNRYLQQADYRREIWRQLRAQGFDVVIAPSRTRPLLLDDMCMLAAAPTRSLGGLNTNVHGPWNRLSDALYTELFTPTDTLLHEFRFNADFAEWACGMPSAYRRPVIDHAFQPRASGSYVLCFIGANTRSKRWPVERWVEFIQQYRERHPGTVVLAGAGEAELRMAHVIQQRTGADSIVGKVSLTEFLDWAAGAQAVVTNDTMAAHVAASCNRPTVIVANGVNYMRFTEYGNIGMNNVLTVYPKAFTRRRRRVGEGPYAYSEAVSADIESITAAEVLSKLDDALPPTLSGNENSRGRDDRVLRHEKRGGVPGLPRHATRDQSFAMQPFGETPIAQGADSRQLDQFRPRLRVPARRRQRHDPEPTHHGPDAAIVILPN
jgi:ADP-heptose:LPS heptosyltransferase